MKKILKPEEINGKMYQPVESDDVDYDCEKCIFNNANQGVCSTFICDRFERTDKLDVYYINIDEV